MLIVIEVIIASYFSFFSPKKAIARNQFSINTSKDDKASSENSDRCNKQTKLYT